MEQHDGGFARGYEKKFENIYGRISVLEGKMVAAESLLDRLDADMYNHGQDGLKTVFTRFVADSQARADERDKATQRHNSRMTTMISIIGVVIAMLTLIVAWLTFAFTKQQVEKGLLKIPQITLSDSSDRVYAKDKMIEAGMSRNP